MKLRLEPTSRWTASLTLPALVALAWAALVVAALCVQVATGREMVLCWFHRVTDLPCPSCGGTRMAASLFSGDVLAAAAFNPLLFALVVWIATWAVLRFVGGRRIAIELHPWQRRLGWSLLAVALVANWLYLIAAGR